MKEMISFCSTTYNDEISIGMHTTQQNHNVDMRLQILWDKMMIMMQGSVLAHMEKCLPTNGKGDTGGIMGTSSPPKEYLRVDRSLGRS